MGEPRHCRTCEAETTSLDSLEGQCPRCLLQLGCRRAPEDQDASRRRFGEFLVVQRLGAGPLGTVHEVVAESSGASLALKRWAAADLPLTEGPGGRRPWPVATLRHPGIVRVQAHGQREDTLWVAMELMPEGSLRGWIDAAPRRRVGPTGHRGGEPAVDRLVRLFAETASALEQVHRAGVVHGGIKPENLLFADGGRRLLLSDFAPANGAAVQTITWLHESARAASYLAPEQVSGPAAVGPPSDVHALAACLLEALRPTGPAPPALRSVLRACLDEDPGRRPASAGAMGQALLAALAGSPPAPAATGLAARVARVLRRWPGRRG